MVSIIIVNYNTKKFISQCLNSIGKYAPKDTEVIVVDNASTDDSIEAINNFQFPSGAGQRPIFAPSPKRLWRVGDNFQLIKNKKNLGYAKAVNQGIKVAKGDFLFILNPDTKLTEGAIDELLEFTLLHKDVITGPRLFNPDGSIQPSCYHEPTIWNAIKEYFLGIEDAFNKYAPKVKVPLKVDAVVGAAMFIPKIMIEKIGLFDERFFMYFEDLDFCRRARHAGLSVYYLPTAKIYHEHGAVTRTVPEKSLEWLISSSKVYHGVVKHTLLTIVLWLGQKWKKLVKFT